jgi:hypothetical protein
MQANGVGHWVFPFVMPGLDPGIHLKEDCLKEMDCRVKPPPQGSAGSPGNDDRGNGERRRA